MVVTSPIKKPRIILITSPKGGVGKTMVSKNMLVKAAQSGLKVLGIDLDEQQSLKKWNDRRARLDPIKIGNVLSIVSQFPVERLAFEEWRKLPSLIKGYDIAVVDTPPGIERDLAAITQLCKTASIVLVPTGASRDDHDSVIPWMTKIRDFSRAFFVLNRVKEGTNAVVRAKGRLAKFGALAPLHLPDFIDMSDSSENGLVAADSVRLRGADHVDGLWNFVEREIDR